MTDSHLTLVSGTAPDGVLPDYPAVTTYVSLSPAGYALLRLWEVGLVTRAEARLLVRQGWAEPYPVQILDEDGTEHFAELITLTLDAVFVRDEIMRAIGTEERPWGRVWSTITPPYRASPDSMLRDAPVWRQDKVLGRWLPEDRIWGRLFAQPRWSEEREGYWPKTVMAMAEVRAMREEARAEEELGQASDGGG